MRLTITYIAAAVATYFLLFPARQLLRKARIVDHPNMRSSHAVPTIRGGGVAIVSTIIGYTVGWGWKSDPVRLTSIAAAFALLAVVSFIDDVQALRASWRFGVQMIAAVIAILAVCAGGSAVNSCSWVFAVLAVLWVTGYTNAFNFMDGINGIAGVQALCAGLGTAAVADALGLPLSHPALALSLVVAGAATGFLPHNFPQARVFMGDVSSAPIGFLLATLAFWIAELTSWWVLFWIALLHANFILDTGITLIRRASRGDRLHDAHREHFYQRLVRAGQSHTRVTLSEAGLQVLVVFALWFGTNADWSVKIAIGIGVVAVWLAFFAYAESVFQKSPAGAAALGVTR